jgi:hypothetical protein
MRRGVGPAGTGANVQLAAFGRNLVTFSTSGHYSERIVDAQKIAVEKMAWK